MDAGTAQVFYNNGADLSGFYHLLHLLKITSFKAGTRDAVIHKEHGVSVTVAFSVVT